MADKIEKVRNKKGGARPCAGRPKGVPNKIGISFKNMIENAVNKLGGEDWLVSVGVSDPKAITSLMGKCMPTVVAGDPENPINHAVCFLPEKTPFTANVNKS